MDVKFARGKVCVLFAEGVIHRETSDAFTAAFQTAMAMPTPVLVISFARAKSLLSDGIRTLVIMADQAHKAGKTFHITDLSKEIKYTLQITNLLPMLSYQPFLAAVLQKYGTSSAELQDASTAGKKTTIHVRREEKTSPAVPPPANKAAVPPRRPAPDAVSGKTPAPARAALSPANDININASRRRSAVTPPPPSLELSDSEMRKVINTNVPGLLALAVVREVNRMGKDIFSIDDIKAKVGAKEPDLKKCVKRLTALGTLSSLGGGLYNYGISRQVRQKINSLLTAAANDATRAKVNQMLLEAEKK